MPDFPWMKSSQIIAAQEMYSEMWHRLKPGDLLDPAKLYLQRGINEQLATFPSQIRLLRENGDSLLFITPTSLVSALWFQFAAAVDGNRNYRICDQCRNWFQIGDGGKRRADALRCSNVCKQRAYRDALKKGKKR